MAPQRISSQYFRSVYELSKTDIEERTDKCIALQLSFSHCKGLYVCLRSDAHRRLYCVEIEPKPSLAVLLSATGTQLYSLTRNSTVHHQFNFYISYFGSVDYDLQIGDRVGG